MRVTSLSASVLLLGLASCAVPAPRSGPVSPAEAMLRPSLVGERSPARPAEVATSMPASTPAGGGKGLLGAGKSYTMVKFGPFYGRGDLEDLDTGLWGEVIFGDEVLSFLALEAAVGYVAAEGSCCTQSAELWGIPVFLQARASLPVLIFEPYGGVGIGGMYVSAEAAPDTDVSDFVLAGNAFLGVSVGLGNLAVGLEGKYLITDEVDSKFNVEGASGVLFVSVPF